MARIRSIHPELLDDPDVGELTNEEFRLWVGLLLLADDEGRGLADPRFLRARVFAFQDGPSAEEVERMLARLPNLIVYERDGRRYFQFAKWHVWQKIDNPNPSRFPEPPEEVAVKVEVEVSTGGRKRKAMVWKKVSESFEKASEKISENFKEASENFSSTSPANKDRKGEERKGYINNTPPSNVPPQGGSPEVSQNFSEPKRKKKTDPRVKRLVDEFTRRLRERVPGVAVPGGRMAKFIQRALGSLDKETGDPGESERILSRAVELFFTNPDKFVQKSGFSWSAFETTYTRYLAMAQGKALNHGAVATGTRPEDYGGVEGEVVL